MNRKWVPTFSELIDRLAIHQLKEVFLPDKKEIYAKEINDIIHDLDEIIKDRNIKISGELIRCMIILGQINLHIWHNESKARSGKDQDLNLLKLTHGLNGIRNKTQNLISSIVGPEERLDWKTDCLAEEFKDWEISLFSKKEEIENE